MSLTTFHAFNQTFRVGLVPLAKLAPHLFKMGDIGSRSLVFELGDDFDGDINDIV